MKNNPAGDKIILITGTRKGIGRDLAEHYVGMGHTVIGCSRGQSSIDDQKYAHYQLDVTDELPVKQMFSEIRKKYGRLDVLINNAAVNNALSPVMLVSMQAAESTMKINFIGSFLMAREAARVMMKNSYGRIINTGSMAIKHEEKGEAIYTASKAALVSLTSVLAKELYQYGITCNIVSPSAIPTDLMQNIDKQALQRVLDRNAVPSMGTTDELIHTLDWLMDEKSNTVTGQHIYLGGV
jgi:3-oxoacyl-[acyl-carrier protein] reductase